MKLSALLLLLLAFALRAGAQQSPDVASDTAKLQLGVLIPKVIATGNAEQSYALYLPSNYNPAKLWPIIFVFDPAAHGGVPLEIMKDAAEHNGFIVAGSNNSRNGSWKIDATAADAMVRDTHARFSIDDRRMYFAGLSGGARLAAQIAQICNCAAGVLLNSAGFSPKTLATFESAFAVFAIAGTEDFNYPEIFLMNERLEKLSVPHFFRVFDGPHEWAPAAAMEDALAWFRIQAMKTGHESRNDAFLQQQLLFAMQRSQKLEQAGDHYAAWKEYRQSISALDGLVDVAQLQNRSVALEKEKLVRDGAKHEKQDFEEQHRLDGEISSGLSGLHDMGGDRADTVHHLREQIHALRLHAEHEKQENRARIYKRALAGVFVQAMELGAERFEANNFSEARDYYELAYETDPDSMWVLNNLAIARASSGDRKGALEILRQAAAKTKDPTSFQKWLSTETAFAKLRDLPEFKSLLANKTPR